MKRPCVALSLSFLLVTLPALLVDAFSPSSAAGVSSSTRRLVDRHVAGGRTNNFRTSRPLSSNSLNEVLEPLGPILSKTLPAIEEALKPLDPLVSKLPLQELDPLVSKLPPAVRDNLSTAQLVELAVGVPLLVVLWNLIRGVLPQPALVNQAALSSLLDGTFLQDSNLACLYKATRDGWSAQDFHEAVDGAGSGLVVAKTASGQLVGGYNPAGWRSTDDYYSSSQAFLFLQTGGLFGAGSSLVKFPTLVGGNAAVFDYATGGPCFGSDDLLIGKPRAAVMGGFAGPDMENTKVNAGNLRQGSFNIFGGTYDVDKRWTLRGGFRLVEVEVYGRGD